MVTAAPEQQTSSFPLTPRHLPGIDSTLSLQLFRYDQYAMLEPGPAGNHFINPLHDDYNLFGHSFYSSSAEDQFESFYHIMDEINFNFPGYQEKFPQVPRETIILPPFGMFAYQ
jgi:hypothetical protein